jgi:hypothetical protein
MITAYHAKYFAHDLTRQAPSNDPDRLSMSLFDATVDLNPHQIEAAMFALNSPLSKGAILADEVGLGKTIEAGIVLCQFWAERKRKLLIICPASLRKQWQLELEEKFNLPSVVLDSKSYREFQKQGKQPFSQKQILIVSYHFAARMKEDIRAVDWNLAVIDEAHKLRNCYRESNKLGQNIAWCLSDARKLLLTATPLQNSLLELYGLSTLIDDRIFGDLNSFKSQYASPGSDMGGLRSRLSSFCKRTLRKDVLEYIRYTKRKPITRPFSPTDNEQKLYDSVSEFLQRPDTYAIPQRQRHLTLLLIRKLLASSSFAIAGTMQTMKARLEAIRDNRPVEEDFLENWLETEEVEDDLLDELLAGIADDAESPQQLELIDYKKLQAEIEELEGYSQWAYSIGVDTKTTVLAKALDVGFQEMQRMGAERKALIFTESRRTQDYLKSYLEQNGYAGQIVAFNGTNSGVEAKAIYDAWALANKDTGRATGSRAVDSRTALVEHFRNSAAIMIATEAAAEGINLQFCSQVVNYDLPWNPQRIEQRIGRCHRYGQQHDVVVINFTNERNHADIRVHELLDQKFSLFNGLFGASDDVLGSIESGVDFEKRILAIYQECRSPEAIDSAFKQLRDELDESIKQRMADTQKSLFEHFDEDVHHRLRFRLETAQSQLDLFGRRFWRVSEYALSGKADFDQANLYFDLKAQIKSDIPKGRYFLISKSKPHSATEALNEHGSFLYRLSHPLGEWSVDLAKQADTPIAELRFNISAHPARIAVVEELKGQSGYLRLQKLSVESYELEEYLLFSGFTDEGKMLDQEACEKLFSCDASVVPSSFNTVTSNRLTEECMRHASAMLSKSLESNNQYFNQARDRLEKWADDMLVSAEKGLRDTKELIKVVKRDSRHAVTLEEQKQFQDKLAQLERKQRKQRQEIFDVEDEIMQKRDDLIEQLQSRLSQKTQSQELFSIRWRVV